MSPGPFDPDRVDLERFQAALTTLLAGIEHPRALAALALTEEAGEVARCVLDAEGYGKPVLDALEGEIGDTLVALAEVATRYGISLARAATRVLEKLERKAPQWRAELAGRLVEVRRRMDGV
jgi:NTP pyrophosphatase (non-canonical NTP hydrolase)